MNVLEQGDPAEKYCGYLREITERVFIGEEGIESADAIVTYDERTEQYSIRTWFAEG